jgi:uncharacterized protein (TIGR03118 family)
MSSSLSRSVKMWVPLAVLMLSSLTFAQHYNQTNLVSDTDISPVNDPNLQNAWGLVNGPLPAGTPWWVSDNANGLATLYSINATGTAASIVPLVVTIPNAPSQPPPGSPTGAMFNGNPNVFDLTPGNPALFIFVTEDGTVQGWNPNVKPTTSVIEVDNSEKPNAKNGAVYKGSTIALINGKEFILAANFRSGHIDIFDSNFKQVQMPGAFEDHTIPEGFAPFNIQGVGPNLYVTYAKQDAAKHDPVPAAPGLGFVTVFNDNGEVIQRLEHGSWMDAPWGVVRPPAGFGAFTNAILIGQFRGFNIAAFNPITGKFLGNLLNPDGTELLIDGLWALRFGNDAAAGPASTLFFTAGPNEETNGLFGTITPVAAEALTATQQ